MSRYLVDTDWIIDVLHNQQFAADTLEELAPDGLAKSVITYGELWEGAMFSLDPRVALRALDSFLQSKELLTLTTDTMQLFGEFRGTLRQAGQPIGDFDLLIAATAVEHDLTLITRNVRHFQRLPDLEIYSG